MDTVKTKAAGDGKLSLELWTPNCPVCTVGSNLAYWARYYTREAADPAVRPKLVVTYETTPPVGTVNITAGAPDRRCGRGQGEAE